MLFNSISFLFFFPIVTLVYFLLPHQIRWLFLLAASCCFYMAFIPIYIMVLFFTIVVDYIAGILIEKNHGKKKQYYLGLSIAANLGILLLFKYTNFFNHTLSGLAHIFHLTYPYEALPWVLPLGLSFHTFQAMSYTFEVYRGNQRAERHLGIYALYVLFYPQLVAGPIERPQNLIHQLTEKKFFDYQRVTDGLKLMAWGMFKKVVIADRLAVFVNQVYDQPLSYQGLPLIIATVFFAFQIYCDFSGYSDIAIGAAQVMGFKLMRNFRSPYFAQTTSEFWRRWHISLSSWFRDYVYIPLGGNHADKHRLYFNLMLVFLLSGLWHGANWTFVVWGALNGFYVIFSRASKHFRDQFNRIFGITSTPKAHHKLRIIITFSLICFSWIFFRARNLSEAFYIATHLFSSPFISHNISEFLFLQQPVKEILISLLGILILLRFDALDSGENSRGFLSKKPFWVRWAAYYGIILSILFFGRFGTDAQQFIYFQF